MYTSAIGHCLYIFTAVPACDLNVDFIYTSAHEVTGATLYFCDGSLYDLFVDVNAWILSDTYTSEANFFGFWRFKFN